MSSKSPKSPKQLSHQSIPLLHLKVDLNMDIENNSDIPFINNTTPN